MQEMKRGRMLAQRAMVREREGQRREIVASNTSGAARRNARLLSEEDREEHDTFDKSCQNDGQGKDVTSSTWVAASGFSGFRAKKADADCCADSGESNVEVTCKTSSLCKDRKYGHNSMVVWLLVFRFPQFSLWSKREIG